MSRSKIKGSITMEVKEQWILGLVAVSATVQSFNAY